MVLQGEPDAHQANTQWILATSSAVLRTSKACGLSQHVYRTDGILALVYLVAFLAIYAAYLSLNALALFPIYKGLEPIVPAALAEIVSQSPPAIIVFLVAFAFVHFAGSGALNHRDIHKGVLQIDRDRGVLRRAVLRSRHLAIARTTPKPRDLSASGGSRQLCLSFPDNRSCRRDFLPRIHSVQVRRSYLQSLGPHARCCRHFGAVHAPLQSIIQHVPVLSYVQRNWLSLSCVCAVHFYLLYVYQRTGNILSSITTHALHNFSAHVLSSPLDVFHSRRRVQPFTELNQELRGMKVKKGSEPMPFSVFQWNVVKNLVFLGCGGRNATFASRDLARRLPT